MNPKGSNVVYLSAQNSDGASPLEFCALVRSRAWHDGVYPEERSDEGTLGTKVICPITIVLVITIRSLLVVNSSRFAQSV